MRCDMPPRPRLRVPSAPPRALRASSPSAPSAPSAPSRPSRLHGPAAPRINVGKLFIKKRTNFACVALRQEQAKRYLQNSVLSHFCFWLRRNAAFYHTSHPTPNAETTAFREIRCFPNLARTCGVLGGDNSLNKQKRRKIYSCVWQKRRVHSKAGIPRSSARSLILRMSLESPRATPIGPSSSTIEARTALATAPLFLTLGLGLVDLAFWAGLVVFLLFFFVLAGACQRHGVDCFNFTIHHQKRFA